ncbi:Holliday junction resolvase RuvX [Dermatophilus congolensis]|uniref:Holliday junction resolvase RuvX n=1 Tax=Dermatophilus congolensis TaxID=1863 RepID=UPI001AAE46D5|nr:Holliday junction resolvase RuvX [Dermatophilus congolensis]MBO3151401.1 Holliday junction resolvase RuvX [Dermatophilus congolensis]MBO3161597.1 Holliday junction resolvase RuvX [Dermatophilus congolensis]MBO3162686.1 Holliday junction resolvase RuvX [Dermatophilus congolensis]MBO3176239.1 Holliday junction resolvase RuvX [Dermatophilus congolensis]
MRSGVRIGVDVGAARVGVATCNHEAILAVPVDTYPREGVPAKGDTPAIPDALERIVALVGQCEPIEIIVGLPMHLSGAEGQSAHAAKTFAQALAARVKPIPVRLMDERLTTVDAHRALHSSGRAAKTHRSVVDQVAAVMILQSALDAERDFNRVPGSIIGGRKPRHRRRT